MTSPEADPLPQASRGGLRRAARLLGWPTRRLLDPRFHGVAKQIDEKAVDLFERLEQLRQERLRINHELAQALERAVGLLEHNHEMIETELKGLRTEHVETANAVATVLGRTMSALQEELRELAGPARGRLPDLTGDRFDLEVRSRELSRALPIDDHLALCLLLGRYKCYVDPADWPIAPQLCLDGVWEPEVTLAIARELHPGARCIDVGASYGYFSLVMADVVGEEGRVVALEPNPDVARLLELSLRVNGFGSTATVLQRGVTDTQDARTRLVVPAGAGAHAHVATGAAAQSDSVEVETTTIDAVSDALGSLDLLKIDAEGAEEAIWRGMQRALAANPDVTVIMEINTARYGDPGGFLTEIQSAGFALRFIAADGSIQDIPPERLLSERVGREWMLFLSRRSATSA